MGAKMQTHMRCETASHSKISERKHFKKYGDKHYGRVAGDNLPFRIINKMKFHPLVFQRTNFQRRSLSFFLPSKVPPVLPEPPEGEVAWNSQVLQPLTNEDSGFFSRVFYNTCDGIQELFASMHDSIGLPWWASVIAGTIVMRFAMLPSKVTSVINSRRMNDATNEFSVRVAPLLQRKFPDKTEYNQHVL